MSHGVDNSSKKPKPSPFNLTLAAILGQVGCLTIFIVFLALFGGLWLDKYLGTKPMFTLGLLIVSVPVTIIIMIWVVKAGVAKFQKTENRKNQTTTEES